MTVTIQIGGPHHLVQDSDAHLFCRRYPPAAKGWFPKVRPEYWCGEHKEATDA